MAQAENLLTADGPTISHGNRLMKLFFKRWVASDVRWFLGNSSGIFILFFAEGGVF